MRRAPTLPSELSLLVLLIAGCIDIVVMDAPPWWLRVITVGAFIVGICQWTLRVREQHQREELEAHRSRLEQ